MKYQCDCKIIHKDVVNNATNQLLDNNTFERLIKFYKMIADNTRIKILFILNQHEMCVCDIANCLGMTKSAISHQLKLLRDTKLVKSTKIGKEVLYTLDDEHVIEMFNVALSHIKEK